MPHNKKLYMFCKKPNDVKHSKNNKFYRKEQWRAWNDFCASTANIQDIEMRQMLVASINATTNPFTISVFYHKK